MAPSENEGGGDSIPFALSLRVLHERNNLVPANVSEGFESSMITTVNRLIYWQ